MHIGNLLLKNKVLLAPMAGITNLPFRLQTRDFGCALAYTEMISAAGLMKASAKSLQYLRTSPRDRPLGVQLFGHDAAVLAEGAKIVARSGADLVDINMGCPAKNVCRRLAGSALMRDEALVARILAAVVAAVTVPVTLKMRTGWDPAHRNGPQIARIAEQCGIQSLAVHGRTRACRYKGAAEFDTIARIKSDVSIPVFANGDITTPEKSLEVLRLTNADGLMIGRGAQGRPWIFRELLAFHSGAGKIAPLEKNELRDTMLDHLGDLHRFYGDRIGVRVARKHLTWYSKQLVNAGEFRYQAVRVDSTHEQLRLVREYFDRNDGGISLAA